MDKIFDDGMKAGTGFMETLYEAIAHYKKEGYTENLVPYFDHLASDSNTVKLWPHEMKVHDVIRFENSSDPNDQSILYLIESPQKNLKGLYVESYGLYHDELSDELQHALQFHH